MTSIVIQVSMVSEATLLYVIDSDDRNLRVG